ncbi:MAG: ATP synthase F1 subunit gamma [Deltaproteobacteria bacterium]|nr:ATP synthase F1 subunit gamma [Deltaproteobacteria bacterium]
MASLKDIRKRIQSVKSTRQITRAMKMVAAAKLRRSQEAILSARPFAYRIYAIMASLASREGVKHPLLEKREEKKIRTIILAGDRGLCGSFNANIFKEAHRFISSKETEGIEVAVDCIGKKAFDFFKKRRTIGSYHEGLLSDAKYVSVASIADEILETYVKAEFDAIYLVYNEFKSAIQQKVIVERLIPISLEVPEGVASILRINEEERFKNYLFEPSKEEILEMVVPRHFKTQLFRSVLESVASEHGARMTAMENATKNASEMIDSLTLQYNKARQASITKELMEIVSGVEAMK